MDRSQSETQMERPANLERNATEKTVNKLESQLLRHETSPFGQENETNDENREDNKTVSSVTNNAPMKENLKIVEKMIRVKRVGDESSGKGDPEF